MTTPFKIDREAMESMNDCDVWKFIEAQDAWIYDKLILSRLLGYKCGPAGVAPDQSGDYIVRPISNYRMMGKGSQIMHIEAGQDVIPDGHFWCEVFTGRHLTFDYSYGIQILAVEGFKDDERTDRFVSWKKVECRFDLPPILLPIVEKYQWLNIEVIGDKIIEVHLRRNDDFMNHNSSQVFPIWKENFYDSPCGDRVGFLLELPKRGVDLDPWQPQGERITPAQLAERIKRGEKWEVAQQPQCWCTTCRPQTVSDMRFVVCPTCGNKRCPRANNHAMACTGSNEPGQAGIAWAHVKPAQQPQGSNHGK